MRRRKSYATANWVAPQLLPRDTALFLRNKVSIVEVLA
jgi:hypothetical protein